MVHKLKLREVCSREEGTAGAAAVVSEALPDRKAPLIRNEGCCSDPIFHAVVQTKMPSQIISRGQIKGSRETKSNYPGSMTFPVERKL
jgi:hypothetical protein